MTIVYMDGFDQYYNATDLSKNYTLIASVDVTSSGFKYGNCLRLGSTNWVNHASLKIIDSLPLSGVVGFWFKIMGGAEGNIFFIGGDIENFAAGTYNIAFGGGISTPVYIARNNHGAYTVSSNVYLVANTWYHFELKYQISNSTTMENILKVNGIPILSFPIGSDTFVTTDMNSSFSGPKNAYYDHFYILDLNGTTNNDFIGPYIFVTGMKAISNGSSNEWTAVPSTGDHYDLVNDDRLYDTDTTLYSTVSGQKELYNLQKFTESVDGIKGIQADIYAGKSGLIDLKLKHLQNINSSEYSTIDSSGLGLIYNRHMKIFETNPATSQPWTTGDLGNNQFGFELWSTGV